MARPERFHEMCSRCGACADRCPEGIIVAGDGGFPEIDFARGACTFCAACADACPEPIFLRDRDAAPWAARALIGDSCLAARGVFCQTCADACPLRAISFSPRLGGVPVASVSADSCNGCGACVATCPVGAIGIEYAASHA